MLSDITFKYVAQIELAMFEQLNQMARTSHPAAVKLVAGGVCVTDVVIDTVKYPVASLENGFFAVINLCGSPFFENCSVAHSCQNVKNAVFGLLFATPCMTLLSPIKLFSRLCVVLPNPAHAKSSNREASQEAKFQAIYMPSSSRQLSLA